MSGPVPPGTTVALRGPWRGPYDSGTRYLYGDEVSFGGSSYACNVATQTGTPPPGATWDIVAEGGTDGATTIPSRSVANGTTAIDIDDGFILADTTLGSAQLNLPSVVGNADKLLYFKIVAGGNSVTLAPDGAETIDGAASYTFAGVGASIGAYCDGTGWRLFAAYAIAGTASVPGGVAFAGNLGGTPLNPVIVGFTLSGNGDANTKKIINLGAGIAPGDAVNAGQLGSVSSAVSVAQNGSWTATRNRVAATTQLVTDSAIACNGTFQVDLLPASIWTKPLTVTNVGAGTITVAPNGAELISGAASVVLAAQWDSVTMYSDGVSAILVSATVP